MVGESQHKVGESGVRQAKKWLDATTRVAASWTAYDEAIVEKLEFKWPHGGKHPYSYDMGGVLRGGEYDSQNFLVECKHYTWDTQGDPFDKFLAQNYVTLRDHPRSAQHFMWITWNPFRIKTWQKLSDPEKIREALTKNALRIFGTEDPIEVDAKIDDDIVLDLSNKIWIIVLSSRQETLVISKNDRAELDRLRTLNED